MWISLAEPFVVPLARSEEGFPIYAHLFVSRLLESFLLPLVRQFAETRSPESTNLRANDPSDMQLEMLDRRRNERHATVAVEPRTEHQRVASALRGAYSRSVAPQRSTQASLPMKSSISSTYAPSR